MSNAITSRDGNKIPSIVLGILRADPRSFLRVCERLGLSKSHISMVAAGRRRSKRVRRALIAEARRIAIRRGYERAIEIEEHARR
jgi:hypothetical protein